MTLREPRCLLSLINTALIDCNCKASAEYLLLCISHIYTANSHTAAHTENGEMHRNLLKKTNGVLLKFQSYLVTFGDPLKEVQWSHKL